MSNIRRIDRVINRFEADWGAWSDREPPRIEDYLGDVAPGERPALLRELIGVETEIRERHGLPFDPDDLRRRFEGDAVVVERALRASADRLRTEDLERALGLRGLGEEEARLGRLPIDPPTRYPRSTGEPVGRGGIGEIYKAHDVVFHRELALKVLQEHRAEDPLARERFIQEAETTARLQHPGIVPIYGLGKQADGRLFYAMRYIVGRDLLDEIRRFHAGGGDPRDRYGQSMGFRALLTRFVSVCKTIAYAHGQGVIHRDIKPANVMLGDFGETIVIDWGMARGSGRSATPAASDADPASMSRDGELRGTPSYMSPEQARGEMEEVNFRSDIYSLGATLYHILTGREPFAGADSAEVLSRVRKGEFPGPRAIQSRIPRPLESICLKAMSMRPGDRFPSAIELATEVERWLAGERVFSHDESPLERLPRLFWRHRAWTLAATAAAFTLLAALAVILGLEIRSQRRIAASNDWALRNFRVALSAVRNYHSGAGEYLLKREPHLRTVRQQMLRSARDFYRTIADDLRRQVAPGVEARETLAEAYSQLGAIEEDVGAASDALAIFEDARSAWEALAKDFPDTPRYRLELARSLNRIGLATRATNDPGPSLAAFERAKGVLATFPDSVARRPDARLLMGQIESNAAALLADKGQGEEALRRCEEARAILSEVVRSHPPELDAATALAASSKAENNLATLRIQRGEPEAAAAAFEAAARQFGELAAMRPEDPDHARLRAVALTNYAQVIYTMGRVTDADRALGEARKILEGLVRDYPNIDEMRRALATVHSSLGNLREAQDRASDALDEFGRAIGLYKTLRADGEVPAQDLRDIAATELNLGRVQIALHREDKALTPLNDARAILEKLLKEEYPDARVRIDLAHCRAHIGLCRASSEPGEAFRDLAESADLLEASAGETVGADEFNRACYLARCLPMIPPARRAELAPRLTDRVFQAVRAARDKGITDPQLYESSRELDPVRTDPRFGRFVQELKRPAPGPGRPPA
jgi:serine/threonine-protein kinase